MPISFSAAKSKALGKVGSSKDEFQAFIATTMLGQYADEFIKELEKNIKASKLTGATGNLGKTIGVKFSDEGKSFKILMEDYFDYVNEGVKGVRSSKNAPTSPYKFKNYGMNAEGIASIKQYILSGKAKVRNIRKDKAAGVGLERKGIAHKPKKALIDSQVDNMIYMIKKYGIKKTDYFTDAFEKVFANWEQDIAEAFGEDIALSISLNTKK